MALRQREFLVDKPQPTSEDEMPPQIWHLSSVPPSRNLRPKGPHQSRLPREPLLLHHRNALKARQGAGRMVRRRRKRSPQVPFDLFPLRQPRTQALSNLFAPRWSSKTRGQWLCCLVLRGLRKTTGLGSKRSCSTWLKNFPPHGHQIAWLG